jgi:Zn-dependent metalloprotease
MAEESTTVKKVEVTTDELNQLLAIPGADSALLPDEKPGFFSKGALDMSFLTKKETKKEKIEPKTDEPETEPVKVPESKETSKTTPEFNEIIKEVEGDPEKEDTSKGRPKVSKDAAIELTKKLIEKKLLTPFDDDKPFEEYTMADYEELFEANFKDRENQIKAETPVECS